MAHSLATRATVRQPPRATYTRALMTLREFEPPYTPHDRVADTVRRTGFAVLEPSFVAGQGGADAPSLAALADDWNGMPPDPYLKDGGHYRRRRHASLLVDGDDVRLAPHRAHFQPPEYNALHGGMERWFTPMREPVVQGQLFQRLLASIGALCSAVRGPARWYVEAHQFRIDVSEGIGRPTPEGAHRDGVDFVALAFVARARIRGGETRVFDAESPHGLRFTLRAPWTLMFLDDTRVIHESTPIQPELGDERGPGYRDTLVLTYRRDGFQERGNAG
jgi:hypothetical protein